MTADSRCVDPVAPPPEGGRYDRDAILKADRWAWAGEVTRQRAAFFYDGFDFWNQLRSGERHAVFRTEAPASGWWHKPACNCPLCTGRTADRGAPRSAAERT